MKILFLDDDELRQTAWKTYFDAHKLEADVLFAARTAKETIELLDKESPFDIVFLDHDLGGKVFVIETEETGYEVALYIEQMNKEKLPVSVVIHTHNPNGARRMVAALHNVIQHLYYIPFNY